jgi:hypothetical protein
VEHGLLQPLDPAGKVVIARLAALLDPLPDQHGGPDVLLRGLAAYPVQQRLGQSQRRRDHRVRFGVALPLSAYSAISSRRFLATLLTFPFRRQAWRSESVIRQAVVMWSRPSMDSTRTP